jgi:hypothetical protein
VVLDELDKHMAVRSHGEMGKPREWSIGIGGAEEVSTGQVLCHHVGRSNPQVRNLSGISILKREGLFYSAFDQESRRVASRKDTAY